jgi:hypothetical protein
MNIVDKIKKDIKELEGWYMTTHQNLSDSQALVVVKKIEKINSMLARYAIKYGEGFYNEHMSKSILSFKDLCELIQPKCHSDIDPLTLMEEENQ